jgi:4-amino-4-deoxy-L-arabinose transferase-like glycosyltransferase
MLYGWAISRQGWGNAYYAAAAQAGAQSWKVMLFGGIDPGGAMATDKPPLALWAMSASVRVFGLSPWALCLPQLLASLATIVVLDRTVRRLSGPLAGIVAAAVLAATPVFGVLARFDDPDTLLVMLLTGAAYATVRAARSPARRWPLLLGVLAGAAFLTKWGVVALVLPGLAAAYVAAVAAHRPPGEAAPRLVRAAAAAAGAAIVTAGWWVALVALTPAASRPHLDATADNSIWSLILGRNGFARMGSAGALSLIGQAPTSASAISGIPGPLRLFGQPFATQIGWLLPLAVAAALPTLTRRARNPRRGEVDDRDLGYLLWGGWLAVAAVVFSLMSGPMHPYYTVLLAPPIAALTAMGTLDLLNGTRRRAALTLIVAGAWAAWIAHAGLGMPSALLILATTALAAVATIGSLTRRPTGPRWAIGLVLAGAALLTGPTAILITTTTHAVSGANPLAGPGTATAPHTPSALVDFLRTHRGDQRWEAAVVTATPAAILALDTGTSVLPLGGFMGSVPSPTLVQFRDWVRHGQVHYLIMNGPYRGFGPGQTPPALNGTQAAQIVTWAQTIGHRLTIPTAPPTTVYDLIPAPQPRR